MGMTLIQLVQAAASEMGIGVPASISGNSSQDATQLTGLANKLGRELSANFTWQALSVEYRFLTQYTTTTGDTTSGSAVVTNIPDTTGLATTYMVNGTGIPQDCYIQSVDSATQVTLSQTATATDTGVTLNFCQTMYTLPSDWQRPIPNTQWDKTRRWVMLGPTAPQMWQWLKSGYIATGPRIHYRILGNKFQIWPQIAANEYLGFEYVSKNWAYNSGGTAQSSMATDADTCVYDDSLMIAGLKKLYWEVKGFDTTRFEMDYQTVLNSLLAGDKGARILRMAGRPANILINQTNVPDSGYGL